VNKKYFICLILFLVFSAGKYTIAQGQLKQQKISEGSFLLDGNISLDSLTKYIHKNSRIRFSFNSVKVKGSREINFPKARYSIKEILQLIKRTTSLYYSFYSGFVIFQDNPPTQKQKTGFLKTNPTNPKNTLAKSNTKSQRKKLQTKSQSVKGKQIIIQKKLLKDTVEQKSADVLVTAGNIRQQEIEAVETKANPKQAANDRSLNDSATAIAVEKDSIPIHISKNISLGDTAKFVSSAIKGDSSIINMTSPDSPINRRVRIKNRKGLQLHYGVQWNINIPVYGFKEYFTRTNGNSQPYNFLIPGLWISKTIGKKENELLFLAKPEQQYFTGNKVVATSTGPVSVQDSTTIRRNTIAIKTNGISVGLQYNYHLNDKWNIGGSLNFNWQNAALINQEITRLSNGVLLTDSVYGIKKSSQDWIYLKSTFVTARLEASYNLKKFAIGCAAYMPITRIFAPSVNNSLTVNGHIFIRWRIN